MSVKKLTRSLMIVSVCAMTLFGVMQATEAFASECFEACIEWCSSNGHGNCWWTMSPGGDCFGECDDGTDFIPNP